MKIDDGDDDQDDVDSENKEFEFKPQPITTPPHIPSNIPSTTTPKGSVLTTLSKRSLEQLKVL